MRKIALFGAGKIGEAITAFLSSSGRYSVRVCDYNLDRAKALASQYSNTESGSLELSNVQSTTKLLAGCEAVISALPFHCNQDVAKIASDCGVHYLDLTEDVATSQFIAKLAASSKVSFMPQCGLAPGFVSIAAHHLFGLFDSVDTVKMRVGALPIFPTNRLKYNLTWSTEGLINEYCNPCDAIQSGKLISVPPLEGYEHFSLDGDEYEAFNTSGGLGTLCMTLLGKVRELDYKSIRYPGHRELISFLLSDMMFQDDRENLRLIMERSIPSTAQDKCIILVAVTGKSNGSLRQKTYASTVYNRTINGKQFGAIQITTAAGVCGAMDLLLSGKIGKNKGLIKTEEISLTEFLANEFGSLYRDDKALAGMA